MTKAACFLSCVEYRSIIKSNIVYMYKYRKNMSQKWDWYRRAREEENKDT
jgi:hypothetical protein